MEKLSKEFRQSGWDIKQLERKGNWGLYERRNGTSVNYEVVKIRVQKGSTAIIAGKEVIFKNKEVYPKDEDFGSAGWCYMELKNAQADYRTVSGCK